MHVLGISRIAFLGASLLAVPAMAADGTPVQIGEGKVFPESVTATADGTIIAGSMMLGQIYKAAAGAEAAELWIEARAEAPSTVLGVYADEASNTLWACYADTAIFAGQPGAPSILRGFDLGTGEVKGEFAMGEGSVCNDITTADDGATYATDTIGGRIYRLAAGADELEEWFSDAQLAGGVDGLDFGPDGALYLNNVSTNKLYRLDLGADGAAGALTELALSQEVKGPDGMRFGEDGTLYLAENAAGQVSALTIEGDSVTVEPVASGYDSPTGAQRVGDTLYVVEAQFSQMEAEEPGPFFVYTVSLD